MFKKLILCAVVLTLSSLVLAQHKSQKEVLASPDGIITPTCEVGYSSGTGINTTTWCTTLNGNIDEFSAGAEEICNVGIVGEGCGLCDTTGGGGVPYYDY